MQPVEIAPELEAVVVAVATERGCRVARDTHYDAFNIELQWWSGNCLHRIDFQPYPEAHVVVTALADTFPVMGKLLCVLRKVVPMFPYLAKTESTALGTLHPPFNSEHLRKEIEGYVCKAA